MLLKILKHPITLFVSMIIGILTGLYVAWLAPFLAVFNQMYLSLLQMCVIPIVACAIILNIGKLFQGQFRSTLKKWFICVIIAVIFSSAFGIGLTLAARDFIAPDAATKVVLSDMNKTKDEKDIIGAFDELSFYEKGQVDEVESVTITDFFIDVVPSNIFSALSNSSIVQIVIFCCALGITLFSIGERRSEYFMSIVTGVYKAFYKFIEYLLLILPVSLCFMLAELFSSEGVVLILESLAKYIGLNYVAIFIIIAISFILIQVSSRCTLSEHLKAVKRTFFVALTTSSCIASTPTVINDIPEPLGLDKDAVNSVTPVSIIFCQTGTIVAASIIGIYSTTIYDVKISINTFFIVLVSAIIFSISITGVPGIIAVTMLSIIFQPLGVPTDLVEVIFLATVPFYQGASVFASLYGNIAITSFVLPHKKYFISQTVS